jgi:hypothetical protein
MGVSCASAAIAKGFYRISGMNRKFCEAIPGKFTTPVFQTVEAAAC